MPRRLSRQTLRANDVRDFDFNVEDGLDGSSPLVPRAAGFSNGLHLFSEELFLSYEMVTSLAKQSTCADGMNWQRSSVPRLSLGRELDVIRSDSRRPRRETKVK
jgi:hypothetical protein